MTQTEGRERRAALLREFEISGLSLAEFCRRAGLAYSTVVSGAPSTSARGKA